jgi:DNA repair protein RecO (recombination protein O)
MVLRESHAIMLHKTRGIVFRFTRYGETSIIVNIFTELFGLQTYIVNGVRSKTSKNKIALYQPLTLLDLVVYHKENANVLRIKEVKCLHPYLTIHQDMRKSAIAMFLGEIVNKTVREESHSEEICKFMIDSFIALDEISSPENFHLVFLLKLSRFLGFGPQTNDEVLEGWLLNSEEQAILRRLLTADYDESIPMKHASRRNVLDALLRFYAAHSENFGEIRSLLVLKEMFN